MIPQKGNLAKLGGLAPLERRVILINAHARQRVLNAKLRRQNYGTGPSALLAIC